MNGTARMRSEVSPTSDVMLAAVRGGVLLILLAGVALGAPDDGPSDATLTGTVVDVTGVGVPGATVVVSTDPGGEIVRVYRLTSDQNGSFRLEGLDRGEYALSLSAPGFQTLNKRQQVSRGGELKLPNLVLEVGRMGGPNCGSFWVRPTVRAVPNEGSSEVTGAVGRTEGIPLKGAVVRLASTKNTYLGRTEMGGEFRIGDVEPGLYKLAITMPGFGDFEVDQVEVRPMTRTLILDVLRLRGCPDGVQCQPLKEVEKLQVCQ